MASRWFEEIPLSDFDDDKRELMTQLRATRWSSNMHFYRGVRSPSSVHDLIKDMRSNYLIWLDEESFILLERLPKSVPKYKKFRKATTSILFGQKCVYVYGRSNNIVERAVAILLCLKDDEAEMVEVGSLYSRVADTWVPTTFITSQFVHQYVETNPQRQLHLGLGCHLRAEQTSILASHPDPWNVSLACTLDDSGQALVSALAHRTTDFGVLLLQSHPFDRIRDLYDSSPTDSRVTKALSYISVKASSRIFRGPHRLDPLTVPLRQVKYDIWNCSDFDDIEPFNVVPKAVTLVFRDCLPSRFHTLFLQGSENVNNIGLIYNVLHAPSVAQQIELLKAIGTNQNLHRLELGCLSVLGTFWDDLLETIGSHGSLRSVNFWIRIETTLDMVKKLATFLEERIHLNITFNYPSSLKGFMQKVEAIIQPVRLRNRAFSLTQEAAHDRPALLGAALSNWAGGSFSNTHLLLQKNTDLLCSFLGDDSSSSTAPQRRRNRDTDLLATPERKIQKRD